MEGGEGVDLGELCVEGAQAGWFIGVFRAVVGDHPVDGEFAGGKCVGKGGAEEGEAFGVVPNGSDEENGGLGGLHCGCQINLERICVLSSYPGKRMDRAWVIAAWCLVLFLATWMRFDDLGGRPFHADEATGARITAARMSGEGGKFDPKHYHGPVLGDVAAVVCWIRGEGGWKTMTKETLRVVPAVAGVCVVLLPWFWRRRVGEVPAVVAGALLAVSPLLVYYSRVFIHEMLLVLAGGAVLACFAGRKPRFVWAGVFFGLMFAVKETFVISVLAWGVALVATLMFQREWWSREKIGEWVREYGKPFAWMVGVAAVVAMVFYTRFFTYPMGAWDAVRTFFVYETVDGHDKPWWWYGVWFGWPQKAAGMWWYECVVLWVAMVVWVVSWLPGGERCGARSWLRFLGFSVVGHVIIYSVFGYKTPWLMCLPWLHVCVLAGFGLVLLRPPGWLMVGVGVLGIGVVWPMSRLSGKASMRLASDPRNPYAYVPTRPDVERVEEFLGRLRPFTDQDVVAVIGTDYWPLPWYLRSFSRVGHWDEPPEGLRDFPFVMVMPDALERVAGDMADTHMPLPRGLRAEVPVWLWIRNDIWHMWMEEEP